MGMSSREPPATPAGLGAGGDRVCFNLGRELYFYPGCCRRGSQRSIDLSKPIDKRIYKGTQPTCHDFNQFTAATETISLLVGFSAGQVQYLDLIKKDTSKLFNEEVIMGPYGSELLPRPTHPHAVCRETAAAWGAVSA